MKDELGRKVIDQWLSSDWLSFPAAWRAQPTIHDRANANPQGLVRLKRSSAGRERIVDVSTSVHSMRMHAIVVVEPFGPLLNNGPGIRSGADASEVSFKRADERLGHTVALGFRRGWCAGSGRCRGRSVGYRARCSSCPCR